MDFPKAELLVGELTPQDHALILQQLINQEADTEAEKVNFTRAYALGKYIATKADVPKMKEGDIEQLLFECARLIYPRENYFGLRRFQSRHGKTGEPIGSPPGRALQQDLKWWCAEFICAELCVDELYFWLEFFHFLTDGNGRLGHIFWAIDVTRRTGRWPRELPPEYRQPKSVYSAATSVFAKKS